MPDTNHISDQERKPLRVACIGGGPGGLFTAISLALADADVAVDVFEQNREEDVFGFGVVFSDATLSNIDRVDPVLRDALTNHGRHWNDIRVVDESIEYSASGNGMSAIHRRVLLGALRERAQALGATLHYSSRVSVESLDASGEYDLIVAADGTNSATRKLFESRLDHSVDVAAIKFIWFGTTYEFEGLTFLHKRSEHGNFAVHAYPIGTDISTFIVETDEQTWRQAGLDGFDTSMPPGPSDTHTQQFLETLFADQIDGHPLVANNSRWANFQTRYTRRWHTHADHGTAVAFIGDSVHTAHFSVGSGTKMAMEDAAVLAEEVTAGHADIEAALSAFEKRREPDVAKVQNSALPSLSWWDHFGQYQQALAAWQFSFHFFSRAIGTEKVRKRDPAFVAEVERQWVDAHGASPLDTPLQLGEYRLASRYLNAGMDGTEPVRIDDGETALTVAADADGAGRQAALPVFQAPDSIETKLDDGTCRAIDSLCADKPTAVVVAGGNALTRVLCSERIRMICGTHAIILATDEDIAAHRTISEHDCAYTIVLSGRADAVGFARPVDQLRKRLHATEAV